MLRYSTLSFLLIKQVYKAFIMCNLYVSGTSFNLLCYIAKKLCECNRVLSSINILVNQSGRWRREPLWMLGRLRNVRAVLHIPWVCPALFWAFPTWVRTKDGLRGHESKLQFMTEFIEEPSWSHWCHSFVLKQASTRSLVWWGHITAFHCYSFTHIFVNFVLKIFWLEHVLDDCINYSLHENTF